MGLIPEENVFGVSGSAWGRWDEVGRVTFNVAMRELYYFSPVARWNAAFVAACEESDLNVEYAGRDPRVEARS